MRRFIAVLTLIVTVGIIYAAIAQQAAAPVYQAPTTPAPADEPNMKVTKDSGGVSTSSLINRAPLPDDFVMGKDDAPIVMIEYASMTCPHCAHFTNTVLPEIEKKYIQTGKLRYILRQFPLNEPALKAAVLLDCVGAQSKEKYFVFTKVLFNSQSKWAFDTNYMAGLETIFAVGGVSHQQFQNCLSGTDREMRVLKVKKDAADQLKIPHTPYIFIGGEVYSGEHAVEAMSRFIDAKLAQEKKFPGPVKSMQNMLR